MINAMVLKGFKIFQGVADADLEKTSTLCTERAIAPGEVLFMEGTRATHLHLCGRGKVDLMIWAHEPFNRNVTVHTAEAGELFGWSAMVAPYTYTASAECTEAGHEIRIPGSELLDFFDRRPNSGLLVMRSICSDVSGRLRQTRQRLSVEWLSGNSSEQASDAKWGEPSRR